MESHAFFLPKDTALYLNFLLIKKVFYAYICSSIHDLRCCYLRIIYQLKLILFSIELTFENRKKSQGLDEYNGINTSCFVFFLIGQCAVWPHIAFMKNPCCRFLIYLGFFFPNLFTMMSVQNLLVLKFVNGLFILYLSFCKFCVHYRQRHSLSLTSSLPMLYFQK